MPRGVYDRSKMKKKGNKTTKAAKTKLGRPKGSKNVKANMVRPASEGRQLFTLDELHTRFKYAESLFHAAQSGCNVSSQVQANIDRMGAIVSDLFKKEEDQVEKAGGDDIPLEASFAPEATEKVTKKDGTVKKKPGPKPGFKRVKKEEVQAEPATTPPNGGIAAFNPPPPPPSARA